MAIPNPSFKKSALTRYNEFLNEAKEGFEENKKFADIWGSLNLSIGLLSVIFSTISAVLTFFQQPVIVAVFSVLSALFTSGLTFVKPATRQSKRRKAQAKCRDICNRVEQGKMQLKSSSVSEESITKELKEIAIQLTLIIEEVSEPF